MIFLASSVSAQKKEYKEILKSNNIENIVKFLEVYPSSKYASEIRKLLVNRISDEEIKESVLIFLTTIENQKKEYRIVNNFKLVNKYDPNNTNQFLDLMSLYFDHAIVHNALKTNMLLDIIKNTEGQRKDSDALFALTLMIDFVDIELIKLFDDSKAPDDSVLSDFNKSTWSEQKLLSFYLDIQSNASMSKMLDKLDLFSPSGINIVHLSFSTLQDKLQFLNETKMKNSDEKYLVDFICNKININQ